ncbi:MAG: hypothetical protein JXQ76_03415 [Campylobacterales bacterium]|nr:hypothetical protein [Campylobacterales bacterium]
MKYSVALLSALAALTITSCGGGGGSSTPTTPPTTDVNNTTPPTTDVNNTTPPTPETPTATILEKSTLAGDITSDTKLTKDKIWIIDGLVAVKNGATLTIEAGTIVAGKDGTGDATSYLVIDKGSKIMAEGTASSPIIFTSELSVDAELTAAKTRGLTSVADFKNTAGAVGQWGGITIIGNAGNAQVNPYEVNSEFVAGTSNMADNSGVLKHIKILNSGITMAQDKEINGLSLVGVGSGTVVEDIMVDLSDDDGVEIWGGTVNLTNITITRCTDDHFDIDDGYSGTVKNLTITQTTGNAAMEMSGDTVATFDGVTITQNASAKEGVLFFKKDGTGGTFKNVVIIDNVDDNFGAIHSDGTADTANVVFEKVKIGGTATKKFTGNSASTLEAIFDADASNDKNYVANQVPTVSQTIAGDITANMTLTKDKLWILDGLVAVKNGATLTIEAGTFIAGKDGTGDATSYLVVDKGSKIMAEGSAIEPITFTSTLVAVDGANPAVGQWGGLTIIGNAGNAQVKPYEANTEFVAGTDNMADNSGVLKHVKILHSGITMAQDKEINGLSFVGVGSGTVVEDITIDLSDDDGIELWGGTVNLTNVTITRCTDDHFDIDDGYSGTVKNLTITQTTGNAAMEMSGTTAATFDGVTITQNSSTKEGGIYFKGAGIGGYFKNVTVVDNVNDIYGAIHSDNVAAIDTVSFENVALSGTATGSRFTGTSAAEIEAKFTAGSGNTK